MLKSSQNEHWLSGQHDCRDSFRYMGSSSSQHVDATIVSPSTARDSQKTTSLGFWTSLQGQSESTRGSLGYIPTYDGFGRRKLCYPEASRESHPPMTVRETASDSEYRIAPRTTHRFRQRPRFQPRTIPVFPARFTQPSNTGKMTVFSSNITPDPHLAWLPVWQRQFSEDNLPIELSVLEPTRVVIQRRIDALPVKDEMGNVVVGCDGQPLLDFRYEGQPVLPDRIPDRVEAWRLVAWQLWAPDLNMMDFAVRMHAEKKNHLEIERETRRLNSAMGRWRKERGGLSMQRRPSGAVAKNELSVINRIKSEPYDWALNTAYNTVWLVDQEANTVTQPELDGRPTSNVHKLSDLGPPQKVSDRIISIRNELATREKDAEDKKTTWDKLEYGNQMRHQTRKQNLEDRKALGMSAFKKSLKDDTLPSIKPKRARYEVLNPNRFKEFDTELAATDIDELIGEEMPSGFGRREFEGFILLGRPTREQVDDFVRSALASNLPGSLILDVQTTSGTCTSAPENESVSDLDSEGLPESPKLSSGFRSLKRPFEAFVQSSDIPANRSDDSHWETSSDTKDSSLVEPGTSSQNTKGDTMKIEEIEDEEMMDG
ncbi:hypothetical protein EV356DRAFT_563852 [Viridothelium virens]|uniref:Uncharacterized protein n=1 Tax=Viridothelium virens TaxID=1048519 RepID=A0A6A6HKI8_VIRVR|nr:hypothetical protein EV356DRAFT_563852 [Viridothelium virens]